MQLIQKGDAPENDLTLRVAQTRGAATKGGPEDSALFIPSIVGPSSTQKLFSELNVNGSADTVPGVVQITTKATGNVRIKTSAGSFTATKLVVSTIVTGHGRVLVTALLHGNGPVVTRTIHASVNDQITWTYYLVPGLGVVQADVSGSFTQTTEFALSFKARYAMAQPAPSAALELSPRVPVTA